MQRMIAAPAWLSSRDLGLTLAAVASGTLAAVSISLVAAAGRQRGGEEATWLHVCLIVAGMCVAVVVESLRGRELGFRPPLNSRAAVLAIAAMFAVVALAAIPGVRWYYPLSGLLSMAVFYIVTWVVVRVSLALFIAAQSLGMVAGSLVMDAFGAFGAPSHEITAPRVLGVTIVVVGVVVVRTSR